MLMKMRPAISGQGDGLDGRPADPPNADARADDSEACGQSAADAAAAQVALAPASLPRSADCRDGALRHRVSDREHAARHTKENTINPGSLLIEIQSPV